jgi:glucuronate isomerase
MVFFGRSTPRKGWTKQLHLGARATRTRAGCSARPRRRLRFDRRLPQIDALGAYLDRLEQENALPKTVIYSLNPADNYAFATMIGNFQDGSVAGKIQFGSGWWFLDQKESHGVADERALQQRACSRTSSACSPTRARSCHTRDTNTSAACCAICWGGKWRTASCPNDEAMIGALVEKICYKNAKGSSGCNCDHEDVTTRTRKNTPRRHDGAKVKPLKARRHEIRRRSEDQGHLILDII